MVLESTYTYKIDLFDNAQINNLAFTIHFGIRSNISLFFLSFFQDGPKCILCKYIITEMV